MPSFSSKKNQKDWIRNWRRSSDLKQKLRDNRQWPGQISNAISSAELTFGSAKSCWPVQNPLTLYYPHAYPPPIPSNPMHALPYSIHPPYACPPPILSHPMHALPLFYPTPCMTSPYLIPPHAYLPPYSIPPHAYPPPILSQPMHTLPLIYSTPCMPSPYSIPPHVHPPPILFQPMHTLPLFYSTPCMLSPNSIPAHAHPPLIYSIPGMPYLYFIPPYTCPLPILYLPTQITQCSILFYSIPAHACPPNSLLHTPWRYVSLLTLEYATFESAHIEYIIIIYLA